MNIHITQFEIIMLFIVTWRLKARIVEQEEAAVTRQRPITKLCGTQEEVNLNHRNPIARGDKGCILPIGTWTLWQRGYTRAETTVQQT
jgi:hypothetical protein